MSETDDQPPRRPPTIELAATEIDSSAEQPAAGEADSASAGANEPRAEQAPAGSNTSTSRASGVRLFSLIASALIGAAVMATVAAVLWFFAVIPAREATPAASIASNMSSAASVSPNALSSPPPTAAAPDLAARLDRIERHHDLVRHAGPRRLAALRRHDRGPRDIDAEGRSDGKRWKLCLPLRIEYGDLCTN